MTTNNFKTVFFPILFAFMFSSFGTTSLEMNQLFMPDAQYNISAKKPGGKTEANDVYQKNSGDSRTSSTDVD